MSSWKPSIWPTSEGPDLSFFLHAFCWSMTRNMAAWASWLVPVLTPSTTISSVSVEPCSATTKQLERGIALEWRPVVACGIGGVSMLRCTDVEGWFKSVLTLVSLSLRREDASVSLSFVAFDVLFRPLSFDSSHAFAPSRNGSKFTAGVTIPWTGGGTAPPASLALLLVTLVGGAETNGTSGDALERRSRLATTSLKRLGDEAHQSLSLPS